MFTVTFAVFTKMKKNIMTTKYRLLTVELTNLGSNLCSVSIQNNISVNTKTYMQDTTVDITYLSLFNLCGTIQT